MTDSQLKALSKVPAVTLGFWIIKILATTLGETGGDTVTMTWLGETTSAATGYGYLIGTASGAFAVRGIGRGADRCEEISSVSLLGDHRGLDHGGHDPRRLLQTARSGIGYTGGSALLLVCVLLTLGLLVLVRAHHLRRYGQHAESRSLLLADHHLLADARHGIGRLDGRHVGAWLSRRRSRVCGRTMRSWLRSISGPMPRAWRSSGPPSF